MIAQCENAKPRGTVEARLLDQIAQELGGQGVGSTGATNEDSTAVRPGSFEDLNRLVHLTQVNTLNSLEDLNFVLNRVVHSTPAPLQSGMNMEQHRRQQR